MDPTTKPTTAHACCAEYASMRAEVSRRGLLAGSLALAGASTMVGSAVVSASPAQAASATAVLVVLSLRGASDGLSLVVPHADPVYYSSRPRIAVPSDRLLVKDGFFGLHPAMAPLVPMWQAGQLAAVHATGLPVPNRSHFSAMEEVEDANPGSSKRVGWLNRLIGDIPGTSPLQGFSASGGVLPTSLAGKEPTMSAGDVDEVRLPGSDSDGRRAASLRVLWNREHGVLGQSMRSTFEAISAFGPAQATDDNSADYPGSTLSRALSTAARVIRGDVGVEVITVDQGDWDMHSGMGTADGGWMVNNAKDFATSLAAFFNDLGSQAGKVTLVVLSEFGRRVVENDSNGLDHGYGNVMFVAGAGVSGGYHGRWPGLSGSYEADLTVTTDYRQVLGEIVSRRFDASVARVFPGFSYAPVGVMA